MSPKKNIQNIIPPHPENPFRVPEGYFAGVQQRVMERIRAEAKEEALKSGHHLPGSEGVPASRPGEKQQSPGAPGKEVSRRKKIYLQPYFSLAAAITGVALVVYIVLQTVMGTRAGDDSYDIALLDKAGITNDESVLAEAYLPEDEDAAYSEWDEEAITYLASNEVDLINLFDNN
jgi:hypothetical protein